MNRLEYKNQDLLRTCNTSNAFTFNILKQKFHKNRDHHIFVNKYKILSTHQIMNP